MRKQPQVTEKTRRKLIESFWKLYKHNDINKITIKDICDNANYERTTFYRYFKDINDILNEIEIEIIEDIKDNIKKNKSEAFSNFEKFNKNYGEYIATFKEKQNKNFFVKFKELVKNDVYNYFDYNISDENKKELIFEFIFSLLINSYTFWYRNKKLMDVESFKKFANNVIKNDINFIVNLK